MSEWQERITHETAPAIRAEHQLRYHAAASLLSGTACWIDLGCGNGVAAAAAFGELRPAHAILVDVDEKSVARAAGELNAHDTTRITADLTLAADLARIEEALLEVPGERIVTCFEVLEHLETFVPLLTWAVALARGHGCTFLLSVPNDAFWSIENPHHKSTWGESAFEEFQRLLPAERTLLRQVSLVGSATVDWDSHAELRELEIEVGSEDCVATHFLAAFGPRHGEIARGAVVAPADLLEQRRWERTRENNLSLSERMVLQQRELLTEIEAELRERDKWFEEWRTYIHELERELGRPLSGASEQDHPPTHETEASEPAGDQRVSGAATHSEDSPT